MRRLFTTVTGFVIGGFPAGSVGLALIFGLIYLRFDLDPPNGSEWQYLGLHVCVSLLQLPVVALTLAVAVHGACVGFRWPDRRPVRATPVATGVASTPSITATLRSPP